MSVVEVLVIIQHNSNCIAVVVGCECSKMQRHGSLDDGELGDDVDREHQVKQDRVSDCLNWHTSSHFSSLSQPLRSVGYISLIDLNLLITFHLN